MRGQLNVKVFVSWPLNCQTEGVPPVGCPLLLISTYSQLLCTCAPPTSWGSSMTLWQSILSWTEYFMEMLEDSVGAFLFSAILLILGISLAVNKLSFLLELSPCRVVVINSLDTKTCSLFGVKTQGVSKVAVLFLCKSSVGPQLWNCLSKPCFVFFTINTIIY